MDIYQIIEIIATVTGIIYVTLEVLQKNSMWYFGILTGIACAISFGLKHTWASMGLNIYYVGMSLWGLYQWRKADGILNEGHKDSSIHLTRLDKKTALLSIGIFIVGTGLLIMLLRLLHGQESNLDAVVTVMSAIGMWWLGRSIPEEWLIWIVADSLLIGLCLSTGLYAMAFLYFAYVVASFIGYYIWKKNGVYIN